MSNRSRLCLTPLEPRDCPATITVQTTIAGTTPDVLGYNMGHFQPGTNAADWMRYSGVQAVRAFINPSTIEPNDDIAGIGDGVNSSASFFARKAALRANAADPGVTLSNSFINWPYFQTYFNSALQGTNRFTVDYAFSQLRSRGVEILANITASPNRFPVASDADWSNKWELWQHYYAEAFYLGRQYDVRRYSMFNEPNGWVGMTPDDWNRRLIICSDAIQSALADVNARYGKTLVPQILAPNTANGSTKYEEWGAPAIADLHLRLDGSTDPNWFNFHIYNYQKYSMLTHDTGGSSGYVTDIQALRASIIADRSGGLPLALTEYNVRANANYDNRIETLDTPSDYAALAANSIALTGENARQLYLFKFAQTESGTGTDYPVQKNGTHYVHNGSTGGGNNYGTATQGAEVYRLFNKAAIGARNRYNFTSNAGSLVSSLVTFDPATQTWFAFIANKSTSPVSLGLNLNTLNIPNGNQAVIEEVSTRFNGGVSRVSTIVNGQLSAASLPGEAVWLVSIPAQRQTVTTLTASADATLADGLLKTTPNGSGTSLSVRADGTIDGRRATLIKFPVSSLNLPNVQRALLDLTAGTISASTGIQAHVYGLNNDTWTEADTTWSNFSTALKQNVAAGNLINNNVAANPGTVTMMLGQLTVNSPTLSERLIDVTEFVSAQTDGFASFLILQEHRWDQAIPQLTAGDTQADGLRIASREAGANAPSLVVTVADTVAPVVASITSTSANGTYSTGQSVNLTLNFSEPVTLAGGNLTLTLDSGATLSVTPFNGSTATASYTIIAGQTSPDLTITSLTLAAGATLKDAAGNLAVVNVPTSNLATNANLIINPLAPTTVSTVTVNVGDTQRSRLTQITLNFSTPVNVSKLTGPGVIQLTRGSTVVQTGATGANGRITLSPSSGTVTSVTLTFNNADGSPVSSGVEYGSLSDGYWQLAIPYLSYASPVNDTNLRRLFGDINNDGTVDGGVDFSAFGAAFGQSLIGSPFDFNADGTIDGGTDFAAFGERFGLSL